MGDRKEHLRRALKLLDSSQFCRVEKISPIYETEPYGNVEQDRFLNGAAKIETLLSPGQLMDTLLRIEGELKRERTIHWGPRTIDLDIIFYDDIISSDPHIILPHPGVHERLFVLKPLCDIAPLILHPVLKESCCRLALSLEGKQEEPTLYEEAIEPEK